MLMPADMSGLFQLHGSTVHRRQHNIYPATAEVQPGALHTTWLFVSRSVRSAVSTDLFRQFKEKDSTVVIASVSFTVTC
jgi:hypothetical protein